MIRDTLEDEGILLYGALKWLMLACLTGALAGGAVGGFLILLDKSAEAVSELPAWRYALIPAGLLASCYCVRLLSPESEGHGTEKVLEDIHFRAAKIPFNVVPGKLLSTLFTLAPGGIVGTEGPSVQIGAGLMSAAARLLRLRPDERKKLVICGASAALSAVFGAPIAGAVFGIEVLFVGEMFYAVLLPSVLSSIASYFVCLKLGVPYAVYSLTIPEPSLGLLFWCAAAAVFFAAVCIFHIEFTAAVGRAFKKLPVPVPIKSLIASGIILSVVAAGGGGFLGQGEQSVSAVLSGIPVVWYAFALKSLLMAVTLSGGGSGGVLTPTFCVGAAAGALFAETFGLDVAFFGALGFVGCVAGCVNTPIAAIFLATELFGASVAPFAGCVCALCYVLSGHRSLYPTQILVRPKSSAFVLADPKNRESWKTKRKRIYVSFFRFAGRRKKTRRQ